MADNRSLREKLMAMASQDASPAERDVAIAKLAKMVPARPAYAPKITEPTLAQSMADLERNIRDIQMQMGRAMKSAARLRVDLGMFDAGPQRATAAEAAWFADFIATAAVNRARNRRGGSQ